MEYLTIGHIVSVIIIIIGVVSIIIGIRRNKREFRDVYDEITAMSNHINTSIKESHVYLRHTGELTQAHKDDAGFDLHCTKDFSISRGYQKVIPTGVRIALPEGYEGQVRPRSGLAAKHKISVTNTPGTIDAGYRGEIKVIMINHSNKTINFKKGDRIAQLVINELPTVRALKVTDETFKELMNTSRSEGGFGSTGTK